MAQELRVGGNEVLLSLAPEYRTSENTTDAATNLLGAVQRFKPLVDFLTSYKAPAECELTTVVVKNVGQVGQRIASVTLDITLRHVSKSAAGGVSSSTVTQPLHLESDRVPSVVLPVIEVSSDADGTSAGGPFAVLFPRSRLALGSKSSLDAPMGFFESSSNNEGGAASSSSKKSIQLINVQASDLATAGFTDKHLTEAMCTPLSTNDIVTGYEGQVPVQLLSAKRTCSLDELQKLMAAAAMQSVDGRPPFVLVPLEDVSNRTTDIHAILAASLML